MLHSVDQKTKDECKIDVVLDFNMQGFISMGNSLSIRILNLHMLKTIIK